MEIYYYNIDMLGEPEQVSRAEKRLTAAGWNERIAAAARFRMEPDKRRCLCAGMALLDALAGTVLNSYESGCCVL